MASASDLYARQMVIELVRLDPDDWQRLRDVRLLALADSPGAFGSTLSREQEFDETMWRSRLDPSHGPKLAVLDGDRTVGMVGAFTEDVDPETVHLVGMWVDPDYRGSGVADQLITGFVADAKDAGRRVVELTVVDTNRTARRCYARHSFRETGETRPYEQDALRREIVMVRSLKE